MPGVENVRNYSDICIDAILVGIATELINSNIREWGENPKEFF